MICDQRLHASPSAARPVDLLAVRCAEPQAAAPQFASDPGGLDKARPLRVLIVEDEIMIAMGLESMVEDFGYEVCGFAATGEDAVAEAVRSEPDVILMDINLGRGIDGIEAARRTREILGARLIFVTAYVDPATLARISSSVPNSMVVNKPVESATLLSAIQRTAGH